MKILGLDPGSVVTGYGIVETGTPRAVFVAGGRIRPRAGEFCDRLKEIAESLTEILGREKPDVVVVEDVFNSKNVRSSFKIAHVRGALLLASAQAGMSVVEYTPAEIKKAVVGNGAAAKEQVQFMVKHLLSLGDLPSTDEADALAAAICHSQRLCDKATRRQGDKATG